MARPISIGDILARSIGVLRQRPLTYAGIAVIFSMVPTLIVVASDYGWIPNVEADLFRWGHDLSLPEDEIRLDPLGPSFWIWIIIAGSLKHLLYAIPQTALIALVARAAVSKPIGPAYAINGFIGWWKLLIVWVLSSIASAIGFILVIVPGIFLMIILSASLQVAAVEKRSVMGSMARSIDLTRGNRWRVLAINLIALLIVVMPFFLFGIFSTLAPAHPDAGFGAFGAAQSTPVERTIDFAVFPTITMAIELWLASVAAQTYVALRNAVDGPTQTTIADTFG